MALGRMGEAEERYRDAIRVDEQVGDRRAREPDMALSYYGLGVALDRDEQPVAAREMIGRALALDPNGSKLRLAQQPGSDVFFIPEGEVYYYLGLAAEVDGRADDAEAAFREYIAHPPRTQTQSQSRGRWEPRARAHLDALALSLPRRAPPRAAGAASSTTSPPPPGGVPSRRRWRMLAVATVAAKGPLPAPLIDAAWKHRPPSIEACLAAVEPAAGQDSVRLGFDVEIDARGAVTRVAARLPPPLDAAAAGAGACMESAIKDGLAVARPEHGKATVARIEVLLSAGPATVDD
jgi:hypothetical protein